MIHDFLARAAKPSISRWPFASADGSETDARVLPISYFEMFASILFVFGLRLLKIECR